MTTTILHQAALRPTESTLESEERRAEIELVRLAPPQASAAPSSPSSVQRDERGGESTGDGNGGNGSGSTQPEPIGEEQDGGREAWKVLSAATTIVRPRLSLPFPPSLPSSHSHTIRPLPADLARSSL